eukprot:218611_1
MNHLNNIESNAEQEVDMEARMRMFWEEQLELIKTTDFKDFKQHELPLARIKKIMKSDEDVRMISAEAPILFAKACELFVLDLTMRAWSKTDENRRRTLQRADVAAAIQKNEMFDFLIDIIPRETARPQTVQYPQQPQHQTVQYQQPQSVQYPQPQNVQYPQAQNVQYPQPQNVQYPQAQNVQYPQPMSTSSMQFDQRDPGMAAYQPRVLSQPNLQMQPQFVPQVAQIPNFQHLQPQNPMTTAMHPSPYGLPNRVSPAPNTAAAMQPQPYGNAATANMTMQPLAFDPSLSQSSGDGGMLGIAAQTGNLHGIIEGMQPSPDKL